jgi:hypothetical protein
MAAASIVCRIDGAFAGDAADSADVDRFLLFSGFDLWRAGGFAHGGVLWSPEGLGRPGFTFKLLIAGGRYQYPSGTTEISGRQSLASAMPGWRIVGERAELTVFAGLDLQSHHFIPNDPLNKLRGNHAGARIGADFWSEPIDGLMVAGSISASTIGPNIWSRAATGVRLFDWAWVGPELQMMGDGHYEQFRAGAHVTSLKTGAFEWSAGFGYAIDSDNHAGAYGRVGLLTRQ